VREVYLKQEQFVKYARSRAELERNRCWGLRAALPKLTALLNAGATARAPR